MHSTGSQGQHIYLLFKQIYCILTPCHTFSSTLTATSCFPSALLSRLPCRRLWHQQRGGSQQHHNCGRHAGQPCLQHWSAAPAAPRCAADRLGPHTGDGAGNHTGCPAWGLCQQGGRASGADVCVNSAWMAACQPYSWLARGARLTDVVAGVGTRVGAGNQRFACVQPCGLHSAAHQVLVAACLICLAGSIACPACRCP